MPQENKKTGGLLDHMAFRAKGLAQTAEILKTGIWSLIFGVCPSQIPGWQLFCFDPFGAKVEFDF